MTNVLKALKGFDADLRCRGFQFHVGGEYRHEGKVKACKGGFHAITGNPLAVFGYYAPAGSRFCRVEIDGATDSDDGEKIAAEILRVGKEIGIPDLVAEAVAYVTSRATEAGEHATGDRSAASATGDRSAASVTGYQSAASATGDQSAASVTGDRSAASVTGDRSAASATGDQSAASVTGDRSAASATGYQSAASVTGDQSAASVTGDQSAASATGYQSAASAGHETAVAMSSGRYGSVSGVEGSALFLVERADDGAILHAWAGIVGRDGIKPGVSYTLRNGKPTEA